MRHRDFDTKRSGDFTNRELSGLLWPLFRPQMPHFVGALLLLLVAQLFMIAGPWLVKQAIDVDIGGRDMTGLQRTMLWYLGAQIGYLVTIYLMRNWLESVGQRIMAALRNKLVDHLLRLPLAFHDRKTPGQLMSRVESDTQALRVLFTTTSVMLLGDLLLLVGMFVVMWLASPRLAAVCAGILPVMLAITAYYQRRIHPTFVEVRRYNAELSSRLAEILMAMPVVRAFARGRWAIADFQRLNQKKFDINMRGQRDIIFWFNLIFSMQTVAIALVLGLGGYWSLSGLVTVGTLAMFLGYIRRFFQPLLRLSEQLAMIQKAMAAAERIFVLLREPVAIQDPVAPRPWPGLSRGIEFENVWFRYDEPVGTDSSDAELAHSNGNGEWVLRDVSFRLPTGRSFALVGPTGSGKTTIASLLLRFYEPQRGRILIDGVDIRDLPQDELRGHAGVVLQDIYLFAGDLRENLTLGAARSMDEIEAAAQATLADRFVERLPNRYRTDLAERGNNLSMGQRQLLSFTRALLRQPEFLILDEATSAVDPATEANLAAATRRVLRDRTSLVIAHRLSTIRNVDHILVLDQGRIVQQGSHHELLNMGGLYRSLYELQKYEESKHQRDSS